MTTSHIEETIAVSEDRDAVSVLAGATGLSKSCIKDAMKKGAVWLGKGKRMRRLRRATATITTGDTLTINYDETILSRKVTAPTLIADEKSYSVWFKPAGVLSSGSRFADHTAIDRLVEHQLDRPSFLVHRLDQFASGLMVLAHDKRTAALLSRQFKERRVTKKYRAIVEGKLESTLSVSLPLEGRDAVSHVTPITSTEDRSLVEVVIETGRKHQIRRHLAELGHPVLGDRQYGERHDVPLALTSCELGFNDPDTEAEKTYVLPDAQQPSL